MPTPRRQSRASRSEPSPSADTPRVLLRYPTLADRAEVLALRRASRTHLRPWEATPPSGGSPFTQVWFDRFLATCDTEQSKRFLIVRRADDVILGQIALGGIARGALCSAYVGYWIGAPFLRQGYMREAVVLAVNKAFRLLRLHRVEANIIPENEPSKALVRSLGFEFEGVARRYLHINGSWRDHEHWATTTETWKHG